MSDWNLTDGDLTNAHRAICEVAVAVDRTSALARNYVKIIPVANTLDMLAFGVSREDTQKLWEFWHAHNDAINEWINEFS